MSEEGFYSFITGIKELARTKKPDERIVVDVYNPCGEKLNGNDEI